MRLATLTVILFSMVLTGCDTNKPAARDVDQPQSAPPVSDAVQAQHQAATIPAGQLPRTVLPVHYRIDLTLLPDLPEFSGSVEIDLETQAQLDRFHLHGRFLTINTALLTLADGTVLEAGYTQVDESGVAEIKLPQAFSGKATLRLEYTAPFNAALEAIYTVKAQDEMYAFTQFEAISAREAFPGFDEPAFKVPFDVSLTVRDSHTAIANTPETGTEALDGGLKRVSFATTKPLPTYLLAFAVGDFDVVEAEPLPPTDVRDRTVPLRAITVKGKGEEARFALDNTRGILEELERYFGIPYPYAKLDILAVPDFHAGAMENAGAITYRDSLMLVADDANPQIKRNWYRIHAHELAHQWFGDLVTPVWWDDIWLNEAFATWMAYVALDMWKPDDLYRRDLSAGGFGVMNSDSLISARKIRQPILSNHDIANAFDGITYRKGGAVLSMFESLLGREAFRAGVQAYMNEHAWGNASADDFVRALSAQSDQHSPAEVEAAFHSFLHQPGLPLIQATLQCDVSGNQMHLSQSRYLPLGSSGSKEQTWKIPVCVKTGSQQANGINLAKTCVVLDQAEQVFDLPAGPCPEFVMPNAGGAGYYRWSLDAGEWRKLIANASSLSVEEMMSLTESLDGAFNAGTIDISGYLDVAQRLASHENRRIATAPIGELEFIYDRMADEQQRVLLQQRFADLYTTALDRVGLAATDDNEKAELQTSIVEFLTIKGKMEDLRQELISMAHQYTGFPAKPGPGQAGVYPEGVNSNLVRTALTVAVQNDTPDSAFANHLQSLVLWSDDAVFRGRALYALGNSTNADKNSELLELVFSPQLRDNEIYNILSPQMYNEETREDTWIWLQQNLDQVMERVSDSSKGGFARYGRTFCDAIHKAEVEDFFGPLVPELRGGPRALAGTLESIDLCMAKAAFHEKGLSSLTEKTVD